MDNVVINIRGTKVGAILGLVLILVRGIAYVFLTRKSYIYEVLI